MALDVKVKIDMAKPIGSLGFGVPLILADSATKAVAYTECSSIEDVKNAGFEATSKVYKAATTMFMQNDAPAKIAVCAATEKAEVWLASKDNLAQGFRQVIVIAEGDGAVAISNVMAAIELTSDKMYFADVDTEGTVSLETADIQRTVLVYAKATEDCPSAAAAVVGATAGKLAGSVNYKNVIVKGVKAQTVDEATIHKKGGMTIVLKAGDIVTSMGKTAGGEYIDLVDGTDYVINNIEYKTQKTLNNADKITFDDGDISILETVCVNVMKDAHSNRIIATDEAGNAMYSVNYAKRANTEASDRAVRAYKGGNFAFTVAGAVDTVDVVGTLEI